MTSQIEKERQDILLQLNNQARRLACQSTPTECLSREMVVRPDQEVKWLQAGDSRL